MGAIPAEPAPLPSDHEPWHRGLTRRHYWIFAVTAMGWLFDTMDQQLFVLTRQPALRELLGSGVSDGVVKQYGGYATAIFLVGWATGGLAFGVLGDRLGRVRTMMITILLYSLFTGLSAFSTAFWDYALYRFLTGLGVGGEFAAGVALLSEAMPPRARPQALGFLQQSSAIGNIMAAVVFFLLAETWMLAQPADGSDALDASWRLMMLVGVLPALLVLVVMRTVEEPESWQAARAAANAGAGSLGDMRELFASQAPTAAEADAAALAPASRLSQGRRTLIGVLMGASGAIGLWGAGFYYPELIGATLPKDHAYAKYFVPIGSVMQNLGGFFGMWFFTTVATKLSRRAAFSIGYAAAFLGTALVYTCFSQVWHLFVLLPILGFCNLMVFAGFAIYFPELFPTRLRSTGTGFCYNVARYLSATGPITLGLLTARLAQSGFTPPGNFRLAGLLVGSVFLVGLATVWFAPETKGRPLPN